MNNKYKLITLIVMVIFIVVCVCAVSFAMIDVAGVYDNEPESNEIIYHSYAIEEKTAIEENKKVEVTEPEPEPTELVQEIVETECAESEVTYYTEEDIIMLSKLLWEECRGVRSVTQQACVVWTVLNRVDNSDSNSICDVIKKPNQFAWNSSAPVSEELYDLAENVLIRWSQEKSGYTDVGRVLPMDYLWFSGNGEVNYFRNSYSGNYDIWDYSLPSPYES